MERPELPPELERLQRELADRPRPEPSAELRDRVMRQVRAELAPAESGRAELARAGRLEAESARRQKQKNGWLAFAAGMAATVLLWMNLSLSAAHATSSNLQMPAGPRSVDATARQIRELLPEMSPQDARRHAVILQSGSDLVRCASVVPGGPARGRLNDLEELLSQGE